MSRVVQKPASVNYVRPWMEQWIEKAAKTQSVEEANKAVGIEMPEYYRGRLEDLAFDAAALAFDQVLDLLILSSVRNKAIQGDPRAQTLYYGKARLPVFVPGFASWRPAKDDDEARAIRPEIAEAMVAAAMKAAAEADRVKDPAPRRRRRGGPPAPQSSD